MTKGQFLVEKDRKLDKKAGNIPVTAMVIPVANAGGNFYLSEMRITSKQGSKPQHQKLIPAIYPKPNWKH